MNQAPPELLQFALADHAFREADALTEHLISMTPSPSSHLYAACVSGIVVTYCRPFSGADGLGKLPQEMGQFTDEDLQIIHDTVVETRNKLSAHFDRKHSEAKFASGVLPLPPSEVRIELRNDSFVVSSNATSLNPLFLPQVRRLCAFQMQRVNQRLGSFAVGLCKTKKEFGEHVFNVTWPSN